MIRIDLHVDGRVVRGLEVSKRTLLSRRTLGALAAIAVALPVVAVAAPIGVPNTFTPGTVISSSEMNANFTAVVDGVNALDTRLTTTETEAAAVDTRVSAIEADNPVPSASGVMAYLNSYDHLGTLHTYSSSGGAITVADAGPDGLYDVTLNGVDCEDGAGNPAGAFFFQPIGLGYNCIAAAITAVDEKRWRTVGGNCEITVACFNSSGNYAPTGLSLMYVK